MSKFPRKRITDPTFKYISAAATDIRKTFAREKRRLAEEQEKQAREAQQEKVFSLTKRAK